MEIRQLSLFPEESGQGFSNTSPRKSKTTGSPELVVIILSNQRSKLIRDS